MESPFWQEGLLGLRDLEAHCGGTWGPPRELGRCAAPVLPWDPAPSAARGRPPALAPSAPRGYCSAALPRPLPLVEGNASARREARAAGTAGCSPPPAPWRKGPGPPVSPPRLPPPAPLTSDVCCCP